MSKNPPLSWLPSNIKDGWAKSRRYLEAVWLKHPLRSRAIALSCLAVIFGLLSFAVFVNRAGGAPTASNWAQSWEVPNSDGSVLFQFSQDVFHHRPLRWIFSPQVYVFPEIPISFLAYAFSHNSLPQYFIGVAVINNVLLFLIFIGLIRFIYQGQSFRQTILGGWLAASPLLWLPLLGSNALFAYQLAPTYYFGAYTIIFLLPFIFFINNKWLRATAATAYILTIASNPLAVVFTAPALLLTFAIMYLRNGLKPVLKPATMLIVLTLASYAVRFIFFRKLVAVSPTSYFSIDRFAARLTALRDSLTHLFNFRFDHLLLGICGLAITASIITLLYIARKYMLERKANLSDATNLTLLYLNLVPVTSLLAVHALFLTDLLHFWPFVVAPVFILLVSLPRRSIPVLTALVTVVLVLLMVLPSSLARTRNLSAYLSYRPGLTICLDQDLPAGHEIGYATFSDARRFALTSNRHLFLIQIDNQLRPYAWLTNKSYSQTYFGSFFIIDPADGKDEISMSKLASHFGQPDMVIKCDQAVNVAVYTNQQSLSTIRTYYTSVARK